MTRTFSFAAIAALLAAAPLAAQVTASADLPPIPAVRAYSHWGEVERTYDDDENATSTSLTLDFDDTQRGAFVRRGSTRAAQLSAGFVYNGRVMTSYPEVVTILLKLTRPTEVAIRGDRQGSEDINFDLEGTKPLAVPASLVSRSGIELQNGRPRYVQDTYVVVLTLSQFLRIVNATAASAQLHDMKLEFTGGPLEGMRDLASRILVSQ